jgi:hypothetical protein
VPVVTTREFRLTTGAAEGRVLTSDGQGNASWRDPGIVTDYLVDDTVTYVGQPVSVRADGRVTAFQHGSGTPISNTNLAHMPSFCMVRPNQFVIMYQENALGGIAAMRAGTVLPSGLIDIGVPHHVTYEAEITAAAARERFALETIDASIGLFAYAFFREGGATAAIEGQLWVGTAKLNEDNSMLIGAPVQVIENPTLNAATNMVVHLRRLSNTHVLAITPPKGAASVVGLLIPLQITPNAVGVAPSIGFMAGDTMATYSAVPRAAMFAANIENYRLTPHPIRTLVSGTLTTMWFIETRQNKDIGALRIEFNPALASGSRLLFNAPSFGLIPDPFVSVATPVQMLVESFSPSTHVTNLILYQRRTVTAPAQLDVIHLRVTGTETGPSFLFSNPIIVDFMSPTLEPEMALLGPGRVLLHARQTNLFTNLHYTVSNPTPSSSVLSAVSGALAPWFADTPAASSAFQMHAGGALHAMIRTVAPPVGTGTPALLLQNWILSDEVPRPSLGRFVGYVRELEEGRAVVRPL